MPYDTLHKVRKLWPKLDIPLSGPKDWPGAKRKAQCTYDEVERRIGSQSRINDSTVFDWAYAILLHTREHRTKTCRDWFGQILEQHRATNTLGRAVISLPLSERTLNLGEVLSILSSDQVPDDAGPVPQYPGARRNSWSEWLWIELLKDAPINMATFDIVFTFTGSGSASESFDPGEHEGSVSDTLQLLEERWRPDFQVTRRFVRAKWPGHYVFYRVDFDVLRRDVDVSKNPYGWFGAQRVICAPLRIQLEGNLLEWEDQFPDPTDGPWKTQGLLVWLPDDTYEVFGFDTYNMAIGGKFLVTLAPIGSSTSARGVIFARERGDVASCYRIWLDRIERPDDYDRLAEEVARLNKEFHKIGDMDERIALLDGSRVLFRTVSDLLIDKSFSMVHYLFSPPNISLADLASKGKVRRIQPFSINNVYLTAALR